MCARVVPLCVMLHVLHICLYRHVSCRQMVDAKHNHGGDGEEAVVAEAAEVVDTQAPNPANPRNLSPEIADELKKSFQKPVIKVTFVFSQ